jgi:hypothetical protein
MRSTFQLFLALATLEAAEMHAFADVYRRPNCLWTAS